MFLSLFVYVRYWTGVFGLLIGKLHAFARQTVAGYSNTCQFTLPSSNSLVAAGCGRSLPSPLRQQHAVDFIGVLKDAGLPAMLQGRDQIIAARLAFGPRMARAILLEHGVLRVVLPSALAGRWLETPTQLARVHVQKLWAAKRMHIVCQGLAGICYALPPGMHEKRMVRPDTQYLSAYITELRAALAMKGYASLPAIHLHIEVTGPPSMLAPPSYKGPLLNIYVMESAWNGVTDALPALTPLLPQLQSVRITTAWTPKCHQPYQLFGFTLPGFHSHPCQTGQVCYGGWDAYSLVRIVVAAKLPRLQRVQYNDEFVDAAKYGKPSVAAVQE